MSTTAVKPVPLEDEVAAFFAHDPRVIANPYDMYRRLREEAPAFRHVDKVLVTRYADAKEVLALPTTWQGLAAKGSRYRNAEMSLDEKHREQLAETFGFLEKRLGGANPPRHSRLRRLAQKAFTPKMIASMELRVDEIVNRLLDDVAGRDEVELIEEFAFHVPLIVISEMLDIPTEDRDQLRDWANDLGQFVGADWSSPANVESAKACVFNLREYLTGVFDARRGGPTTDLLGALIAAEGDEGERFTEDELVAMILQFVFAGHETTTNTIGNAVVQLLNDSPEQWKMLCDDPALLPGAVEELLRFASPTQLIDKLASEPFKIAGLQVEQWETLSVVLASANRDPEVFEEPDRFDILRKNNAHVTFGWGPHHCIGAALSRLEVLVVLRTFIRRFPEMRCLVASENVRWRPNAMLRGPFALPVAFGRDHG